MLDLGTVRPGSTIRIPINTFDSNDPSASATATTWLNTDCHVHKDGGTTQRASSAGETLSIDFDTVTGNHLLEIDLADNTTANFYEAGSEYHVRIEGVTVDAGNINAWIARFRIGYEGALLDTTIATLSTQVSFTLEDGSTDDDAYNGCVAIIHDLASAVQVAMGVVSDYTGSTKTVTLKADPAIFTMAAGDNISLLLPALTATARGTTLDVTATGAAGIDWGNVENKTTANDLSGTDIQLVDTTTTNTDMRGTDSAALATVCTEARLAELDAANLPTDVSTVDTVVDGIQTDLDNATDGLGALKALIDTVDTVVDAIKAKTDSLTFTLAGDVDANVQSVEGSTNRAAKLAEGLDNTLHGDVVSATDAENFVIQLLDGDTVDATLDTYNGRFLTFTNGANIHQTGKITDYDGSGGVVFAAGSFTATPGAGDDFVIT